MSSVTSHLGRASRDAPVVSGSFPRFAALHAEALEFDEDFETQVDEPTPTPPGRTRVSPRVVGVAAAGMALVLTGLLALAVSPGPAAPSATSQTSSARPAVAPGVTSLRWSGRSAADGLAAAPSEASPPTDEAETKAAVSKQDQPADEAKAAAKTKLRKRKTRRPKAARARAVPAAVRGTPSLPKKTREATPKTLPDVSPGGALEPGNRSPTTVDASAVAPARTLRLSAPLEPGAYIRKSGIYHRPERLVIDLVNQRVRPRLGPRGSKARVRFGRHADYVRLVIDVDGRLQRGNARVVDDRLEVELRVH